MGFYMKLMHLSFKLHSNVPLYYYIKDIHHFKHFRYI